MNRLLRDRESGSRPAPIMPRRYRQQAGCGTSSGAAMVPATPPRSNTCRACYDAARRPLLVLLLVTVMTMMRGHVPERIRAKPLRSDSADQELLGIRRRVFSQRDQEERLENEHTSCPLDGGSSRSRARLISPGGFEFCPPPRASGAGRIMRQRVSSELLSTTGGELRRLSRVASVFRRSSCARSLSRPLSFIYRCRSADSL